MSLLSTEPVARSRSPASESGSRLYDFLIRELPPKNAKRASYFLDALIEAGERYDRYVIRTDEWSDYASRRRKLKRITTFIEGTASGLEELDILSRDDLAGRVGSKEIDELVGSLHRLGKEASMLLKQIQTTGRPRDLAEERWILELADLYENAFQRPAALWGGKGGAAKGRGGFYQFLELGRPKEFPKHGKLHPRQVDRLLKQRRQPRSS